MVTKRAVRATYVAFPFAFAFLGSSSALECYNTCFEDCGALECLKNNGESICKERTIRGVNVTLPGFIIKECSDENDVCLLREFVGSTLGTDLDSELALMTTPGGCLSEFKIDFSEFQYWERSSTQLFTCDLDLCNIPSVEGCVDDRRCALKKANFTEVFENVVRGGDGEELGKGDRCILEPFQQIDESSSCLEEGCSVDDILEIVDFVSCSDCDAALNCDVNQPTPSPTEIVFPTDSPTTNPTKSPEERVECYNTCFEDCFADKCLRNNGNSVCKNLTVQGTELLFPGYIIETCPNANDVCLMREFIANDLNGPALLSTPGGCLSQFTADFTEFEYWDRSTTQLFTCDSNRCNVPSVEGCIDDKKCPLKKDNFTEIFGNVIRGGGEEQLGKSERCILEPFIQIDETSTCLEEGCSVDDLTSESIEFISCTECEDAVNCEVTEPTPSPSEIIILSGSPTLSPTTNPSHSPTKEPTFSPTNVPTKAPSFSPTTAQPSLSPTTEPTKTPSHSPTKEPSLSPTTNPTKSPTEFATIQPSFSPTQTPTNQPTQSPTHIECYNTCFEDCSAEQCLNDKNNSLCRTRQVIDRSLSFPGYIIEGCTNANDVCLQREFFADGIEGLVLMTVPGGCLSNFVLNTTSFDYWDRSSTQLYTCDSDRCNEPPVAKCVNKKRCVLEEADANDMFLNVVRGGGDDHLGKDERCILNPFSQINETSSCLTSGCIGEDLPDSKEFVSCSKCSDAVNCNEKNPTPAPSDLKFSAEKEDQTVIIILAVGFGVLAVGASAFACYTKHKQADLVESKKLFEKAPMAMEFGEENINNHELDVENRNNLNTNDDSAVASPSRETYEVEAPYAAHDPDLDDPIKGVDVSMDQEEEQNISADMVEMLSI